MLVYLYNTHLFNKNLFTGVYKRPPPHKAHSCVQVQHGERGNVRVVRERGRTADDRVIKAELHPPHQPGRQATVHPSIHATHSACQTSIFGKNCAYYIRIFMVTIFFSLAKTTLSTRKTQFKLKSLISESTGS